MENKMESSISINTKYMSEGFINSIIFYITLYKIQYIRSLNV